MWNLATGQDVDVQKAERQEDQHEQSEAITS